MRFRVGPYLYRVRLIEGYIDHEGEECLGLCDNEQHELLISNQANQAQQIQVVCHEYMEAWLYHFGADVHDKETYCDLFGLAMTQFVLDLMADLREAAAAGRLHEMLNGGDLPGSGVVGDGSSQPSGMEGEDGGGGGAEALSGKQQGREDRGDHEEGREGCGARGGRGVRAVRVTDVVEDGLPGTSSRFRVRVIEPDGE